MRPRNGAVNTADKTQVIGWNAIQKHRMSFCSLAQMGVLLGLKEKRLPGFARSREAGKDLISGLPEQSIG